MSDRHQRELTSVLMNICQFFMNILLVYQS